jgi:hypothetical protein
MSREAHVRFWESAGVQLPRATHLLVLNERHLRRILTRYFAYYHHARTHLALDKDAPKGRAIEPTTTTHVPIKRSRTTAPSRRDVQPPSRGGRIRAVSEVGGLHHRYQRVA